MSITMIIIMAGLPFSMITELCAWKMSGGIGYSNLMHTYCNDLS